MPSVRVATRRLVIRPKRHPHSRTRVDAAARGGHPLAAVPPTAPSLDLDQHMRRVALGDQEAFESLYEAVAGPVYGIALRVLRDRMRAEEVAQEALLDVWRTAARFDPQRGTARAYIFTIVHRRAVDVVRHDQSSRDRDQRLTMPQEPSYDVVASAVQDECERDDVRKCLSSLTALQKQALTLVYYDGYTYAQVATLLGVNPTTVKARVRDGLLRLRAALEQV